MAQGKGKQSYATAKANHLPAYPLGEKKRQATYGWDRFTTGGQRAVPRVYSSIPLRVQRIESLRSAPLSLRLLVLMASTVAVISLRLLRMREYQHWTGNQSLRFGHWLSHRVIISEKRVKALHHWRDPTFPREETLLDPITLKKVVTNASLMVWRVVFNSRMVWGV